MTTTPEGFGFAYEYFARKPREKGGLRSLYGIIQASTYDNAKNLPDGYIDSLLQSYRDAMELPLTQVKKGIRSLDKQIQLHLKKISDPEHAIGSKKLDQVEKYRLIRKWEKDIERQRELKFIYHEAVNTGEKK